VDAGPGTAKPFAVAKALIGYGNASQSGSPPLTAQISGYERKRLPAAYRVLSA
jgi:hypothetical protein